MPISKFIVPISIKSPSTGRIAEQMILLKVSMPTEKKILQNIFLESIVKRNKNKTICIKK